MNAHRATRIALLLAASAWGEPVLESPTLSMAQRAAVEAKLADFPAVAASLPAHPLSAALLDQCIAAVFPSNPRSALQAISRTFPDAPLGIYAVDCYQERFGADGGFLAEVAHTEGDSLVAMRAARFVGGSFTQRIEQAAALPTPADALTTLLAAWSEAPNVRIAALAMHRAHALIAQSPYAPLRGILQLLPVPPSLLRSLAQAFATARPKAFPAPELVPLAAQNPTFALALDVIAFQSDASAFAQLQVKLADAAIPADVRTYCALRCAERLVSLLRVDDALRVLDSVATLPEAVPYADEIVRLRRLGTAGVRP